MPISVYSIQVRGRDIGGSHRCANEAEAQSIYDQLKKGVNGSDEFFEITLGTTVSTARKSNISGFSMAVHMEETPEERKARAIAQIENQSHYAETGACEIGYANNAKLISGSGLI
jgi:hypothetical protein